MTRAQARQDTRKLERNPIFDLSDTYVLPASDTFLVFLFRNLEVAGSLARATNTVNLRIEQRGRNSFSARTRRVLEGHCYRHRVDSGSTRFIGRGTYRQDYVPFAIRGLALVDLRWRPRKDEDGLVLNVRLRVTPASNLIRVVGTVFYPLVNFALRDVLERVVNVGRRIASIARHYPRWTLLKLEVMNSEHADRWRRFLKTRSPARGNG